MANLGGWDVHIFTAQDGLPTGEVLPVDDIKEHGLGVECWCKPELNALDRTIVHNSADGRESVERGETKVS